MAKACRFTAPYGSREIYHDGKPFIDIHRALDKHGTGHSRPVDVDDTAREILALLCGTRRTKSALAGSRRRGFRDGPPPPPPAPPVAAKPPAVAAVAGWWPFSKKPAPKRRMDKTVMFVPDPRGGTKYGYRQLVGARKRRR